MKSTRQEELQKKPLSPPLEGWQGFLQQNASRILLALTLIVLAALIFRYRSATAEQRASAAKLAGARARTDLQQLKEDLLTATAQPEQLAARRDQLTAQIIANLTEALADSADSDTTLRADAYTTRGDLYWTLANSPVFTEAATRPSLATKESPDTLLGEAEADYQHVIDAYSGQMLDWAIAQFGLAAIAENRGNWDDARKRYEEVEARADAPDMFKTTAQMHLGLLERMKQPIWVGPYPATSTTPSAATATATTAPTTAP
jgi:hypothetical protein